jgi:hypothetical protein
MVLSRVPEHDSLIEVYLNSLLVLLNSLLIANRLDAKGGWQDVMGVSHLGKANLNIGERASVGVGDDIVRVGARPNSEVGTHVGT